jgi:hypothetical protein
LSLQKKRYPWPGSLDAWTVLTPHVTCPSRVRNSEWKCQIAKRQLLSRVINLTSQESLVTNRSDRPVALEFQASVELSPVITVLSLCHLLRPIFWELLRTKGVCPCTDSVEKCSFPAHITQWNVTLPPIPLL